MSKKLTELLDKQSDLEAKASELKELANKYTILCREINTVKEKISIQKKKESIHGIDISHHAIVRYLERSNIINLPKLENKIITKRMAKKINNNKGNLDIVI